MSTTPNTSQEFASIVGCELQLPGEAEHQRPLALSRTLQFVETVASIRDGTWQPKIERKSAEEYTRAGELLLATKSYRKDLKSVWEPHTTALYKAHRDATGQFNIADKPAELIEKALTNAREQWRQAAEQA